MKKYIFTTVLLLVGMMGGFAQERVNKLEVESGVLSVVTITQGHDSVPCSADNCEWSVQGDCLHLKSALGGAPVSVVVPELVSVRMNGIGKVKSKGILKGEKLHLCTNGVGNVDLNLDYDSVFVEMNSVGDVKLQGACNFLQVLMKGPGNLSIDGLLVEDRVIRKVGPGNVDDGAKGRHREETRGMRHGRRSCLLDGRWQGLEIGPNMLLNNKGNDQFGGGDVMAPKGLGGICLNFNLAEIGVAFDRKRHCGIFTGIGLALNVFKMKNPYYFYQEDGITKAALMENVNVKINNVTLFYLQAPLMFQVSSNGRWYAQAGVIGGLRLTDNQLIQFGSNYQDAVIETGSGELRIPANETKVSNTAKRTSTFKLDVCLRVGGENIGFFATYSLIPLFPKEKSELPEYHPITFGVSLVL